MRSTRFLLLLAAISVAFSSSVSAQPGRGDVAITPVKMNENIHMLIGQGGNIGFLSNDDGVLLVDTQFQHLAPKILKTVGEMSKGKIKYVLNTHFHGDHTGGNATIGANATIVAHDNVRSRLKSSSRTQEGALPDLTYSKKMTIHFGDEEIHLIHLGPGHTDSDSVVHFKSSNVIHMGDLFFNGRFPYVDLNSGGSIQGYLSNIKTVAGMADKGTKIIPGHGDAATVSDLLVFIKMFEECRAVVSKAKANGKSLEEIQKDGLPKKYESWGKAFINSDRWISFLYQD